MGWLGNCSPIVFIVVIPILVFEMSCYWVEMVCLIGI